MALLRFIIIIIIINVFIAVSDTTRKPRPGEVNGKGLRYIYCYSANRLLGVLVTGYLYWCYSANRLLGVLVTGYLYLC